MGFSVFSLRVEVVAEDGGKLSDEDIFEWLYAPAVLDFYVGKVPRYDFQSDEVIAADEHVLCNCG